MTEGDTGINIESVGEEITTVYLGMLLKKTWELKFVSEALETVSTGDPIGNTGVQLLGLRREDHKTSRSNVTRKQTQNHKH